MPKPAWFRNCSPKPTSRVRGREGLRCWYCTQGSHGRRFDQCAGFRSCASFHRWFLKTGRWSWQAPNRWSKRNESVGYCFKVSALARAGRDVAPTKPRQSAANTIDSGSDFMVLIFMIPIAPRAFIRFNATTRSSDFSANMTQVSLPSLRVPWLPRIGRDLLGSDSQTMHFPGFLFSRVKEPSKYSALCSEAPRSGSSCLTRLHLRSGIRCVSGLLPTGPHGPCSCLQLVLAF
jgi:hypothetical protein